MSAIKASSAPVIYTIGHSTRTIEEFIETLNAYGVRVLADVRTVPGSRKNPQFGHEELKRSIEQVGISYLHMKSLGGLRKSSNLSDQNSGWTHDSFRSYSDYANTGEFRSALDELESVAHESPTAIMCAEAVPWRCHRRIIADHLVLTRGWQVIDILDVRSSNPHKITPFSVVSGGTVIYPPPETAGGEQ